MRLVVRFAFQFQVEIAIFLFDEFRAYQSHIPIYGAYCQGGVVCCFLFCFFVGNFATYTRLTFV